MNNHPPYEALSPSKSEAHDSHQPAHKKPLSSADKLNIFLLLTLYFVQGIPLGLFDSSIPFLLLAKKAEFTDLGLLSFFSYPFAMKILFAPFEDAHFSEKFGKRKTYIIPCQYLLAFLFLLSGFFIEEIIEEKRILALTIIGFVMIMMAALQDIAVDGWQLTLLDESHLVWGSVAQSVGQTLGQVFASSFFIQLNSLSFCNDYIYKEPQNEPILDMKTFCIMVSVLIFAITFIVHFFKRERNPPNSNEKITMWGVIKSLSGFFKNKNLKFLLFHLLFWRLGFCIMSNTVSATLIKNGFPKETLINILTALIPLSFLVSFGVGKMNGKGSEMRVYLFLYILKIFDNFSLYFLVKLYANTTNYIIFFSITQGFSIMVQTGMFVVWGGFVNRISDTDVGGTYLTFLASMHNFGNMWTGSLSYYLVASFNYDYLVFAGWGVAIMYYVVFRRRIAMLGKLSKSEWSLKSQ